MALTRLSALIALGFMPGLPAVGASFSDQVTFSTSDQSLWGNAVATDFLGLRSPLAVKWGTYAGNAASQLFSFDGITSLTDPVFGASLGRYGVAASFSSSGTLGLDISSYLRGGTLGYTQTLKPLLSLPDSYTAHTRFTVSAVDSLGSTPKLSATMPVINLYVDAKLKFDASLSATGCFINCTSTTQNFSIGPGPVQLLSWDSQRSPAATVAGQGVPSLVAGSSSAIALPRPDGGTIAVGHLKVVDSFPNGCDSAGVGAIHCGNNVLSANVDLSALASLYGAPVDVDRSFAGINFKSRLLDVTLASDYWVDLDLKVDAPVFTRLVFDKPVTEFMANGQSVLHSDGVVSFAMGSSVSLAFGSQVGTLIKRTYYLDDPGFSAAIATVASLKVDSKVGCGFSVTAFGTPVVPNTTGNCLTTDSTTLSTGKDTVYNGSANLNTVRTAATYQGLGSTNLLNLSGVYGPGNPVTNAGAGSLASVAAGELAAISGVGARWTNTRAAQTSIAGTLRLEAGGLLDNSEGAELLVERGATLTTAGFDAAYALSELRNSKSATAGAAPAVINNFGSIHANGRVTNSGTINNHGNFTLNAAILSFNGGVFNNGAGGSLTIGDDLYTLTLGSAVAGTINLLPDSKLIVNGSFSVAPGYKQINEGEISVAPTATQAGFSIYGELQFGNGSVHGSMAQGELKTYYSTGTNGTIGGVVSFHRSDNTSFSSLISGSGSVVKRGVNTLTLTANQTYTGPTTVESGRLTLAGQTRSSDIRIGTGAQLEMQAPTDRDNTTDSRFTGQGTLVKTGGGTLLWGASRAVFALDAGARIDVLGGTFVAGSSANDDWSQNQAGLFVASGATFWGAENNVRLDALNGSGRIHSGFNQAGYEALRFGVAGGSGTFSGVLADTDAANRHIGSFIKQGAGTQVLSGANTFTGSLQILAGQVQIGDGGSSGSLAARLIGNQAELSFSRSDDSRFDGLIAGSGNLTKLGTGRLTLAQTAVSGFSAYTGVTSVRGGTLVLTSTNHSRAHDLSQGAVLELQVASGSRDGAVATQFSGQGTLRKTGPGPSLWGASAATFAMAAGSLIDVQAGSFVGGSSANEDWRLNQSALNVAAGASFHGVEANVRVDGLSGGGRITSGYASAGYTAFTMGVANGSGDFSGVLADSSAGNAGHFVKVGTGTQTLSGSNTHVGGTTLAGGVLSVARDANLGGKPVVFGDFGGLIFQGGTLRNTSAFSTDRTVILSAGGGVFDTAGGYLTINSDVVGFGGLVKSGGDILTLAGAQGYGGATVISAGTLKFAARGATASSLASPGIAIASGARLIFADSQTYAGAITGAGGLMHEFGGTTTLTGSATHSGGTMIAGGTLQVGDGGSRGTLAGDVVDNGLLAFHRSDDIVFTGHISGSGGVQQRGSGTLTLTGAHTYHGATTVSAGAIQLNGSALNSAFTVGAGATLGGNARVGTLVVAGTLAPGNSPGQISAGATTFASGGQYLWEINDGTGLAGIGHDLLNVAGTLNIDASPGSRFTLSLRSLLGDNTPGNVVHFDAQVDHHYTLVCTSGGILGFSADEFAIDSSGFGNATFGGQWAVGVSGQDLTLNFTAAVPEPGTYALLLAGLAVVGGAARRRRSTGTTDRG